MDTQGPESSTGGVVRPDLLGDLLPYLAESLCLYDRTGLLKARVGPPDGVLGIGETIGANVFANLHPDDLPLALEVGEAVLESEPGWTGTFRLRLRGADSRHLPYQIRVFNRLDDPRLAGVLVAVREVVPDDEPGLDSQARQPVEASLADALPTPYLLMGTKGNIRYANPAAARLLATTEAELYGTPLVDLASEEDRPSLLAAIDDVTTAPGQRTAVTRTSRRHGDRLLEVNLHSQGTEDRSSLIAVVLVDRTAETELIRQATHDPLTGVANRTKLTNTVTGLLLEMGTDVSVVYVDLDHFKTLNDTHGHAYGDRVLVAVADRLRARTRAEDLVARMSGDEFVVVCPRIGADALDGLLARLAHPVTLDDGPGHHVTLSVGAARALPGDTAADLIGRADAAMFAAKRTRRAAAPA